MFTADLQDAVDLETGQAEHPDLAGTVEAAAEVSVRVSIC